MDIINPNSENKDIFADQQKLETFCLIWLDHNVTNKYIRNAEEKIRSVINRIKCFNNLKECKEFVEDQSKDRRIVMIVSGQLGQEIVPEIHHLRHVVSIYVYCKDKERNKPWADKYAKVQAVINQLDELVSKIAADYQIQKNSDEPLQINVFGKNNDYGKSTSGINGKFVFYHLFIDCLLQLKPDQEDRKELIKVARELYKYNPEELKHLDRFEKSYVNEEVIWWYTRESFFYKILNGALRMEHLEIIFLFREFISDIYSQLKQYQCKNPLTVYRCQMMSTDEFQELKNSIGHLISINSFFSTSTKSEVARSFIEDCINNKNLEPILFKIKADPNVVTTKPFADISHLSKHSKEYEVLFMIGSMFRLDSIAYSSDDQMQVIHMTLCNENEHDLKDVIHHLKDQLGKNVNLRTLAKILWKSGKFDLAEKYLLRYLPEIMTNDLLLVEIYDELGDIQSQSGNSDTSMEWYKKASQLKYAIQNSKNNIVIEKPIKPPVLPNLKSDSRWAEYGETILNGRGMDGINHLSFPSHICIDGNQMIIITDCGNHRILQWNSRTKRLKVIAGGYGEGNRLSQLNQPSSVLIDDAMNSLIICDGTNKRCLRWSLSRETTKGEILVDKIRCFGVAMDSERNIYLSDTEKNIVKRYTKSDSIGTIVAGGNGKGANLNQLSTPTYIIVDQQQTVYISERSNHRVTKWTKGATEGIVVAGGHGKGNALTQLSQPEGIFVDTVGTVYVADSWNHRIVRWPAGAQEGSVIACGKGRGHASDQLNSPSSLSFDQNGNLYVADCGNDRIQRFSIK